MGKSQRKNGATWKIIGTAATVYYRLLVFF